jgi:hypothetical protein
VTSARSVTSQTQPIHIRAPLGVSLPRGQRAPATASLIMFGEH